MTNCQKVEDVDVKEGEKVEKKNVKDIVKEIQSSLIRAVGEANALPKCSHGYELCASYPPFAYFMREQEKRINLLLQKVLRNAHYPMKVASRIGDLDEFLDRLVEANDNILDRVSIAIDTLAKAGRDFAEVPRLELNAVSTVASSEGITMHQRYGRYAALLGRLPKEDRKKTDMEIMEIAATSLAAKEKPQNVYGIKVDNSDAPFMSKLKKKHHACDHSTNNLVITLNDDERTGWNSDLETSTHPYNLELLHFKVPSIQQKTMPAQLFKPLEQTELIYVDTTVKLKNLRDVLNKEKAFAVDVEHNWYRSYLGLTCLLQVSTRDVDYIIDPFPIWDDMHILNEPFTDPRILKVFHGAESDVKWLQRDFGIYVVNMFDTRIAMKELLYRKYSLQYLINECCDVQLNKGLQKADWRIRPLTDAHILYARSDTHYLLYCYDLLRNKLLVNSNKVSLLKVYEESVELCLTEYIKPTFEVDGCTKLLIGRKKFNSRQLHALTALWKWRDERARVDDESTQFIMPNHMLIQIAEVLPREMQGILACCCPVPAHVKRELPILHEIIVNARDRPLIPETKIATNIDLLTFDDIVTNTNKLNTTKALLRCHLDFSSTKYSEEIRSFTMQKDFGEEQEKAEAKSGRDVLEEPVYEIGTEKCDNEERLKVVLEKLENYAAPFECYRIAISNHEEKEQKNQVDAEKGTCESVKKRWSHLDPPSGKELLAFKEEKVEMDAEEIVIERKKRAEEAIGIDEEMTLTKKALKKKRKRERGVPDIGLEPRSSNSMVVEQKRRKKNWTDALDACENVVDYSVFSASDFNKKVVGSDAYDSFKVATAHGKWKAVRNRRGRGRHRVMPGYS